jgi:hypothetical protein
VVVHKVYFVVVVAMVVTVGVVNLPPSSLSAVVIRESYPQALVQPHHQGERKSEGEKGVVRIEEILRRPSSAPPLNERVSLKSAKEGLHVR